MMLESKGERKRGGGTGCNPMLLEEK